MSRIERAIERAVLRRNHNALITETFEKARSQAQKAAEPFPMVIKDCFSVADLPTTCASKMLMKPDLRPTFTATVVRRLERGGGCLIGKANMDEFSMGTSSVLGAAGPVKSTLLDSDFYVAGGSSGGSAVAVKLGMADLAIGSDTGGSTRNPAAFNGLYGFLPSYGALSRHGVIPLVCALDSPAILTRTLRHCARFFEMMLGRDENDSTTIDLPEEREKDLDVRRIRVGLPRELYATQLSQVGWNEWNRVATLLKDAGASVEICSIPSLRFSLICYHVLAAADVASNMARYDGIRYGHRSQESGAEDSTEALYAASRHSLGLVVRRRILAGNFFLLRENRARYFERAQRVRTLVRKEISDAFKRFDVILAPAAAGPPPKYSELLEERFEREAKDDYFTQAANLAGIPALCIPTSKSRPNHDPDQPVGVQLWAPRLHDRRLLRIAELVRQIVGLSDKDDFY